MLSISSPGPNRKRKDSQSPASATAAEANAAEALAGLSSYTERDTQAHGGADGANSSHSDTQTDTACPAGQEHSAEAAADDQQPQQARKRRRRIKQTTQPADDAIGAAAAGPGSSDPPVVAEGCKHASGVAKRVVEAPDGSCSVELVGAQQQQRRVTCYSLACCNMFRVALLACHSCIASDSTVDSEPATAVFTSWSQVGHQLAQLKGAL